MIDTKALREKILDLAIRGKLVPQDPNDEPATVLLERIREQKQQMVKEGKLKAKDIKNDTVIFKGDDNLHYEKFANGIVKCIEDEIPFELPEGWAWSRLNTIAENITDGDHQPPPQVSTGIPFLVISNLSDGELHFENTRFVDQQYFEALSPYRKAQYGDILFTVTGSYGIPVLVDVNRPFCFQRHIAIIRPLDFSSQFIIAVLGSAYIKQECDFCATGIAQKTVGLSLLRNFLIPIPPALEQNRIIQQINNTLPLLESLKSNRQELLDSVYAVKFKILDLAIRGKLVPQDPNDEPASVLLEHIRAEKEELIKAGKIKRDKKESIIFKGEDNSYYEKIGAAIKNIDDEIPFELPNGWVWTRITGITDIVMGSSPEGTSIKNSGNGMEFHQGKIAFTNKFIANSGNVTTAPTKIAPSNSVLLCVRAPVGEVNITERKICIGRGLAAITPLGELSVDFMFYWLQTYKDYLNIKATGSTFVAVTADAVKGILLPIPPLVEQKKIVDAILKLNLELDDISSKLN